MAECEVCERSVDPPDVQTDAPLVCIECYTDADDWPSNDLPRSESGTAPDLWVAPLLELGEDDE